MDIGQQRGRARACSWVNQLRGVVEFDPDSFIDRKRQIDRRDLSDRRTRRADNELEGLGCWTNHVAENGTNGELVRAIGRDREG